MGKVVAGIIVAGLGIYAWQHAHQPEPAATADEQEFSQEQAPEQTPARERHSLPGVETDDTQFHCDGRVYCSQMTSCEEATYFLEHCPGVKMDNEGHGDGVPCERQWCRKH